jgi:hypothetical protein
VDLTEVFLLYRQSLRTVWNDFARGVEGAERHFAAVEVALFDLLVRPKMHRRPRTARIADRSFSTTLRVLLRPSVAATPILRAELEDGEWVWREDRWTDQRGDLRYTSLVDVAHPADGRREFAYVEAVVVESYDGLRVGTRILLDPEAIRIWEIDAALHGDVVVDERSHALPSS